MPPSRRSPRGAAWGGRSSHTAPGFMPPPATAAHRVVASRCGSRISARARRATASSSASPMACAARSGTETLLLTGEPQRVDQVVEVAVQHLGQVVHRVVNAVIGNAILRKVIRPDLGRAIARADLGASLAGAGGLL